VSPRLEKCKIMNKIISLMFSVIVVLASPIVAAEQTPAELVKSTTTMVIDRIQRDKDILEANPKEMLNLVSEYIFPAFDFDIISQWVLGESWVSADDETREVFIDQFRQLLVRTYATALLQFSDQKIEYPKVDQKAGSRTVVVRQDISTPNMTMPIIYKLYKKAGSWKVFDVSIDGVSLVKTYRASFGSMISNQGLEGLIMMLQEKNSGVSQ
jgi:phospholipid transport system substrate-binding protein